MGQCNHCATEYKKRSAHCPTCHPERAQAEQATNANYRHRLTALAACTATGLALYCTLTGSFLGGLTLSGLAFFLSLTAEQQAHQTGVSCIKLVKWINVLHLIALMAIGFYITLPIMIIAWDYFSSL